MRRFATPPVIAPSSVDTKQDWAIFDDGGGVVDSLSSVGP